MMIEQDFDFQNLFILDLANNHQGNVEHGLRIIQSTAEVIKKHSVRAAIKFQFRQLDSFIHPSHQKESELKYIQRFQSTRLDQAQFQVLLNEVWAQGLLAMCTPFDEESVHIAVDMGFNLLKVASCSAKDWPLLEEIANAGPPVVCSTGGLTLEDIDNVTSFFQHRAVQFALMHCVSIYPTPDEMLALNQIHMLRNRYPNIPIGWSTHENPDDTIPVQIAVAFGAKLFERHVGIETETVKLNAYSSTPEQVDTWLEAHGRATVLCGPDRRPPVSEIEQASLDGLRRGVFAKRPIKKGHTLSRDSVYFAMPYVEGQLESGHWKDGYQALQDVLPNQPVMKEAIDIEVDQDIVTLKTVIHEIKAILNEAKIQLGSEFKVEYSHHYGLENFRKTGAVIIECINREYCKKLVVQLPGQRHPSHYHTRKEETFQILYGILHVNTDGYPRILHPGETILIQPGVWHSFWTDNGVIFEEVSTTHYNNDSFYADKRINKLPRSERKTVVDHWGRFQITHNKESQEAAEIPIADPQVS
ncbi:MAG: N-acetylneuraminate synthase family protein [Nitrospirae bacterium]|nr:N-acetylneuraminate synthase family protein [Nitrospirota bacterium]